MSDISTTRRRQQLLDKFLSGQIDKATYDALLAELEELSSASVVSESLICELSDPALEVIVATSDPRDRPLAEPTALMASGVDLGNFRIEKRLGRGGMGEVWQAHDLVGERTVVIKLLHPEFVHHPDELASVKQMFQRVHSLQHQNICPLYLLGQNDRFGYYVVMKYIDGQTLSLYRRQFIEVNGQFTLTEVARVLVPVAKALDYAHRQKVVHCDVKPQNIMITSADQSVQLVDFGLAAEIRSTLSRLSSSSVEYGGTYPYMSPEQWRGEILDGKTDQYALAIVAYELLAGHRPFHSADPAVLRMCALNDAPNRIKGIDASINAALLRGLAKSKDDRFETCVDFIKALCNLTGTGTDNVVQPKSAENKDLVPARSAMTKGAVTANRGILTGINSLAVANTQPIHAGKNRLYASSQTAVESEKDTSLLERANRQAIVWVSLFGLVGVISFVSLLTWLVNSLSTTPTDRSVTNQSSQITKVSPSVPPPIVEGPLRYRWQPERAYIYGVSVDLDQDQDRVLTFAGDLAYSVSLPVSPIDDAGKEKRGTGTAFVVHSEGHLITCHHVTDGATEIEVTLGGKTYAGSLVVSDPVHDLAIIRIEATGLPCLPLADSDTVQQGEEVRAVGFPLSTILGENIKATRGTISGINQDEGHKVFQVDAAINPGNSGGPLVDEKAEVIGVIYAKLVEDVATGVGFATPVNAAKALLNSKQIPFTQSRHSTKLDGPALVREVSAATALVTVKSIGTGKAADGRVSLRCDGTLNPKSWRRSVGPADAVDLPTAGRQLVFSPNGAGPNSDQVETDALGRVHAITGNGSLPSFLGQASRLIVEMLPPTRQRNWSYSHPVTLSVQEGDENPRGFPAGPRFGPGGFGPRFRSHLPFGPRGFGPQPEPTTKEYPGHIRVDYTLGERKENLQTIRKAFELKTDELVGELPRIQLVLQGDLVFNTANGLPQESEITGELVEAEPNKTTKTPVKLAYKWKEERKIPGIQGQQAPPPVKSPGKPVEPDSSLEVGSKLVCEWAGKWQQVTILSLKDNGQVRVHWEGWSDQWDEDVDRSRLRFPAK